MTQKWVQGEGSDILGWEVLNFMGEPGGSNTNLTCGIIMSNSSLNMG